MGQQLLVATRNPGKLTEVSEILDDLDLEILSLDEQGIEEEIIEDGLTFSENALKKALTFARISGILTLADDSGLEVDALGGRPGVKTARFGGTNLLPEERYRYLLALMMGLPLQDRTARFHCAIVLALPGLLLAETQGVCEGLIGLEPRGKEGFGYDPVFYISEYKKTMAELLPREKHHISHRGRAINNIKPLLKEALATGI